MAAEKEEKTTENWLKEAQKGYIRIGVLILLNKKPAHGYEIMKEIDSRTKGFWQPTPGGVYPILRDLENSGYIKGRWETQRNRKLKIYKLTKPGELILRRAIIKQAQITENIASLFREFAQDVLQIKPTEENLPTIPSFFTPFLEDKPNSEETLEHLELERRLAYDNMKKIRDQLKQINTKIGEIKKTQNASKQ